MPGPTFEQVQKGIPAITEHLKAAHSEAEGLSSAFNTFVNTLLPIKAGIEGLEGMFGNVVTHIKAANVGLTRTVHDLEVIRHQQLAALDEEYRKGKLTDKLYNEKLALLKDQNGVLEAQKQLAGIVEATGARNLALLKGVLVVLGLIVWRTRELNQNLINANSYWGERNKLMYGTLMTQVQIGSGFSETTQAAKALVFWGFENRKNFQDVLKTVMMLNDGLGMSIDLASELATVVERRVGGNFERVADVMAELVNDTALTADEAGRLALNLARIMETVKPGVAGTVLPDIAKLVGGYESAIKRLGGQAGMVEQWLSRLTTPEGLLAAGALGVQSPEFIQSQVGVQQVMQNFQRYAEGLLQNAEGWDRRWRLDALGQQMGMTADQASLLLKVIQDQSAETSKEISIRERFKQQIAATGEGLLRLGNTLLGLLQGALYPVIRALNIVINAINETLMWVMKFKPVVVGLMAATGVAVVALVYSMRHLIAAFWQVVVVSRVAAIAAQAQARATAAAAAASAFGGGGSGIRGAISHNLFMMGAELKMIGNGLKGIWARGFSGASFASFFRAFMPSIISGFQSAAMTIGRFILMGVRFLTGPIGIAITIITVLLGFVYKAYRDMKKAQDEERMAKERLGQAQRGFTRRVGESIYRDFRYGDFDWIQNQGMKRLQAFLKSTPFASRIEGYDKMTDAQKKAATDKAYAQFYEELATAQYTRQRFDRTSPYVTQPSELDRRSYVVLEEIKKVMEAQRLIEQQRLDNDIKAVEDSKLDEHRKVLRMQKIMGETPGWGPKY